MRVANQSASAVAFPHAPQSAKSALDSGKIEEAGPHMPFAALLGKQVQMEAAQLPNQTPRETNAAATPGADEFSTNLPSKTDLSREMQPATDLLPAQNSLTLQQTAPVARALPESENDSIQNAVHGAIASSPKSLPAVAVASLEGGQKAVTSGRNVQVGPMEQHPKTEERKGAKSDNQPASQLHPHIPGNAASAIANTGTAIPNALAAVNPAPSAPAVKAETSPSPVNTPSAPEASPHLAARNAPASREASVSVDDNSISSIIPDGSSGSTEQQRPVSPPISVEPASAVWPSRPDPSPAPSPEPQQADAAHPSEKHAQVADGTGSLNPPPQSTESVGKLPNTLHAAPAHTSPAQIAVAPLSGKSHDAGSIPPVSALQSTASGAQSSIAQSGENSVKPGLSSSVAANPFDKLDQYPSGDPIVLHGSAQRIAVGVPHPSLGWVEINTQSTGDRIAATLVSASDQTHQHLAGQLPSLTQYLADREVKVSSVVVHQETAGATDGGVSSGTRNSQEREPRSGGNRGPSDSSVVPERLPQASGASQIQEGQRLSYIDIHA